MAFGPALRSLRRSPVYAIAVVVTLAVGLAAVGSMVAVVHGVLLAPLPYGEPDRLVSLQLGLADGTAIGQSPAFLATYRRHSTQLEDVALYRTGSANVWTHTEQAGAEHLTASWVTASTMRLLQAPPLLGRSFTDAEERRGGPEAVVLSEPEWRSRFASAPDILGQTLIVNDVPREIVGVMPARFAFPAASTRIWLPVKYTDTATMGDFLYTGLARLAPGATPASAQRELAVLLPKTAELFPRLQSGGPTAAWLDEARPVQRVLSLREALTDRIAPMLWLLAAVAGLVLLVAWANVANLMLVRTDARRQGVAIREALGASPLRASAPAIAESVLLGSVAAVLALLGSLVALGALKAFAPADLPRMDELTIGPWTAGIIVLVALLGSAGGTAILARLNRSQGVASGLHDGARGQTSGRRRQRLRSAATAIQIAAALVVLAGSGLLLRTAQQLHSVHPGFEADQVTTVRILLPFARYDETARVAFHARLTERASRLPSVQGAGLTARVPLGSGYTPAQDFVADGTARRRSLPVNVVSGGYFKSMAIPVLAGRDFRPLESQRPDELIVSQRAAALLFDDPRGTASLGRTARLEPGGPTYTVVGVVGDARYDDLALHPSAMVYRAQVAANAPGVDPGPLPGMVLSVRSTAPQEPLVDAIRSIVRDLDPGVPVFEVNSMADVVRQSMASLTLMLSVLTVAASVTLLLGMIGLYGVMAYVVTLRTREFGLRMALGADPRHIARWVLGRGLALTAFGVGAGLALFALAVPYLRALINGVPAWDPLSLLAAIALLVGTAALACWSPARHAASVDPAQALRAD
jgi:putative ABC transport system permease protein